MSLMQALEALQLPLVFVGGVLGSSHCVGMCGGFALAVGCNTPSAAANLRRQLVWTCGRVCTYSFGGAAVGYLGSRVAGGSSLGSLQGGLAVVAGVLLIVQGVFFSGLIRRRPSGRRCAIESIAWLLPIGRLLKPSGDSRGSAVVETFVAGVMTGFLPCGLVYAYLALAGASGHFASGMLIMLVFGLGTAPVMLATGIGASLLSVAGRARVFRIAALCVVVTGVLTVGRGIAALHSEQDPAQMCPMCREADGTGSEFRLTP